MATRIRTLNFLPEIFKTTTNSQFLNATLDQLVAQPNTKKIEGYVGSKFGYGVNAKDKYVTEPTKIRTDYQLDPGVTFLKKDTSIAQDFISYPGIIDGLELEGALVSDNNRLFTSQFYSWDSFTNLDKIINFNQYYWLPEGPDPVTVSTETVYNATDYIVTSLPNGYLVVADGESQGSINPTLTLLRGGTYRFSVNQDSEFWIQGMPGVTGYDPTQTNVQTREVLGVDNNGTEAGVVTFTVPFKNAQDEYNFPGNNRVDVVSSLPYDQVNGVLVSSLTNGIDGITSLEGLTLMFYGDFTVTAPYIEVGNTYKINELGTTDWNVVAGTSSITYAIGDVIDAISVGTGTGTATPMGAITKFYDTTLFDEAGGVSGYVPPGTDADFTNFDGGFYTDTASTFYTITYEGDPTNPVIRLVEAGTIPVEEKITANYGTEYIGRTFYLNTSNTIILIPYLSAILDTLYYQDGTSGNKVGQIRLIASNTTNRINVLTDVIGRTNYTSPNGVVFTNGLKVTFSGDIYPSSYENVQYYVEGVGTAIQLVPVADLVAPEPFTFGSYIPYDTLPYDIGNYDSNLYVPVTPDYITIARNSIDKNAWSRSNRWFHIDVINATATYNNNPESVSIYATADNKAKRPIIEFYPNLRLFNAGVIGKNPIDFIDFRTTDALNQVAGQENYYPDVEVYTNYTATINGVTGTSTTITIAASAVTGAFQVGQYINDSTNILPLNTQITAITGTTTLTLTVGWATSQTIGSTSVASLIANDSQNDNYALFEGARIVFAADDSIKNKIYVARFNSIAPGDTPTITLTEATDGLVLPDEQTFTFRGYNYKGEDFYFDGIEWILGQQKTTVNQPPLFDVFDENNISFGNRDVYVGTSFIGNKLFAYGLGSGTDDIILGFPLRYSSVDNVGDISFDVSLNSDTFNYVSGTTPITQKVNTGYVFNHIDRTNYFRELGWQTAVGPSVQYQIFEFNYDATNPTTTYTCDIAKLAESAWPTIQLFVNNVIQPSSDYTVTTTSTQTIVEFTVPEPLVDTVIEILLLSDQVSKTAYYQVPINLNNNPLNADITVVNVGDIRGQYQSIFYNNPDTTGTLFGSNNYRDLGNVVPYGNAIIQNSASLVLPGTFLRKQNHNLFNALMFNSREYITFKTLLVDTVNNTSYGSILPAATMLDDALDKITAAKTDSNSFFWSDMLPSKAAYITNSYSFANALDTSIYPLSKIYNFATANYNSVLVYLTSSTGTITQLIRGVDYVVSTDSPSLTVTISLSAGDQITIREYNQTYGSYVPNTPTKLGLYPATIPSVTLDSNYSQPTYFIVGHDGSYTKLYGDYIDGRLIDFRDQVLLEFETRIYNNLKLSNTIPIQAYEVLPGFFRDTDYSYDEILQIYSSSFLDWVGQNRISYKKQFYNANNEYSYNYNQSGNKINGSVIPQGYWRGIYEYFYDTSTPDTSPWEMLGYKNMPTWWTTRYGAAPYTSDNLVLWNDLAQGIDWNNGTPVVIPAAIRPELLQVLPVDSAGDLVSPFDAIVGNYSNTSFNRDWKVGDVGPAEFSYRRSSSWPFDLMRILALTKPAEFFNLAVDIDNYKYNEEFNQYLVNDRSHLVISDVEIYGNGIAKTSYINWIVDFEKQVGIDATTNITDLLDNLDVRLVYRLAGFSDKNLLKFYVEKSTANSNNSSLLIPDESYQVLLYDNQPFDRIVYSGIVVQLTDEGYYKVYGNSQTNAYFNVLLPKINGNYERVSVQGLSVQLAKDYYDTPTLVAYGTEFYTVQEVAQFLESYGRYLSSQGVLFDQIESGLEVSWRQMVAEYLYWAQSGWEPGSIVNINPAANLISINKDSYIVQPLTLQQQNFVLNQNLYPIQSVDLSIVRDGTLFTAQPLNSGDTVAYGQFNISNFEHGIVFDNTTLFGDMIYNLTTGLRQNRIALRGTKTADWNGTVDAQGFILNQDNIKEWSKEVKYTTGSIVKYKNKYWIAITIIQAKEVFDERDWKVTDYNEIQKGLLPNTSTRSYESTLYYDVNKANLENDADLLSFSLIGYRPRDYLALANLTDITQINVYKNFIKNKGTRNAVSAFKGANLPQGGIDYEVYENWAIKSGEFGGVLNSNFVDFKLNQTQLTGNPSIVGLTNGVYTDGVQQEVPLYSIYNYGRPITDTNVLPLLPTDTPTKLFPDAGYANFNDMRIAAYYYYNLANSTAPSGEVIPLSKLYVGQYVWIANYQGTWDVMTPVSLGQVIFAKNNLNGTVTLTFNTPHNLNKYQPFAVVNFNDQLNGYYVANTIVDPYNILVNVTLDPSITTVTGQGIGFRFQSQRVAQPSDIINLPLLNNEFVKNKVWVDTNTDGSWAVYRKGINYNYDSELVKDGSESFGSSVAYTDTLGYLVGDADAGRVYRYVFNELFQTYQLTQTLTGTASFGSTITYQDDIFVISQPTGATSSDRTVNIYQLVINTTVDELQSLQSAITARDSSTNWGSAIALSGDKNWLYISAIDLNRVYVYNLSSDTNEYEYSTYFTVAGLTSGDNFGYSLTTDYYGDTVIVGAPNKQYDINTANWGYTYVYDRTVQNFEVPYTSLPDVPQTFTLAWAPSSTLYVSVNGTIIADSEYSVVSSTLSVTQSLTAGDIITVSGNNFVLAQTLTTETTPKIGVQFGISVDTNTYATEVLVGAPFEIDSQNQQGAVYRYTNGGGKYGMIIGTNDCAITTNRTILINGYMVVLGAGNATSAAASINSAKITNIQAVAQDGKLIIGLIDNALAQVNDKLNVTALNSATWAELGFNTYTQTQAITDPHVQNTTQFGNVIKFNEFGSFVTSAPKASRYEPTTFDSSDDENYDNDTLFDNNATQWVDTYANAGAVYMYDYVSNYNETLVNVGKFVYAQSTNDRNETYGYQPMFGHALDFNQSHVVIGTPNFKPDTVAGQVITYINDSGITDWSVYRSSNPVVDTSRIQDIQLYSALTNNTLDNLDYIDPLQGKILGSVRQNIDVVSNVDPAGYNSPDASKGTMVWGAAQVGQLWFNTSTTRFVNYHQNDIVYNSKWWGQVFPGSDVSVYSWITSDVPPISYAGPGTPFDINSYAIEYVLNSTGVLTPIYFYWVRNTNVVFTKTGKTLSDSIIQSYIASPINSGISYFAPLQQDIFALYNCGDNINANDTVLHIGFSTGVNDDTSHSVYNLIRSNYADDFLPGLPGTSSIDVPRSLYDRLLDSLCGVDESGGVVPDPYLPKPVQYGIYARPRQSFFVNRFLALKNYLTYANEVLAQYPITETRRALFLNTVGATNPSTGLPFYETADYWTNINWWATGYDDNTKSALQVPTYADLSTIDASAGLIVTVTTNGDGKSETYVYTNLGTWDRIGLQDGTIAFDSSLWDYSTARLGFGDNFFDTTPYDTYPSQETRSIVRALNEQIYTNELQIYRNRSLILLFEYIQSETIESQNYLPWLNKTSFIDVAHTIRELRPIEVFQTDNQDFLSGYINEVKPYHVVIKEFLFKYTGTDVFEGDITDFDLPAQYNSDIQQFVTPELVYANPSASNQYLPTDPIWQTAPYSQWFNNYGLSITGVNDYQITVLASYLSLNTNSFAVDNAFGFPINGTVLIGDELIGYSIVDRANNTISGLTRGVDGTPVTAHIPGEIITIDLPAVLLLDGGRGYTEPPKITAYIDTTIYPAPRRAAVLEAVMSLDSILRVNVVDPGDGYAVLPQIIIDPSISIAFASSDVNTLTNTIALSAPFLQTGDLVTYTIGANTTPVGGLDADQYYYVNVLETAPTFVVALYANYADALNDHDRVVLFNAGSGSNNALNVSARASCISTSVPIRENQITLRFDRTSYSSQVTEWQSGQFYGSYYAGLYNNSERVASSSITLQSTLPPIDNILASAEGAVFEIEGVTNDQVLTWSSRTRNVVSTVASTDIITIAPSTGGAPDVGTVGPTTGFYVNMPIKFEGAVGSSLLVNNTTYYVKEILSDTEITISASVGGSIFPLGNATIGTAGLLLYVGEVTNTAVVTLFYPGILNATNTTSVVNSVTIPKTASDLGGTTGFYLGLPIFFTGDVFGGVIENETYYITTVIDDETFTMSTNKDPIQVSVTATNSSNDRITCNGTATLSVNDPIIFENISTVTGSTNIVAGTVYYVSSIVSNSQFIISSVINGGIFDPGTCTCTMTGTNQKDVVQLTTVTGSMTCNVGLPVSPGQVTGQQFTFYPTSATVVDPAYTEANLIERTIVSALADGDYLSVTTVSGGITNIYNNMPIRVAASYGGLSSGTTYYVVDNGIISTEVTSTTAGNELIATSTSGFYADMPIIFDGFTLGGTIANTTYFVKSVSSGTNFKITDAPGGAELDLYADSGSMTATGAPYVKVSSSLGGSVFALTTSTSSTTLTQYPTSAPAFDVSWVLGGYLADITSAGTGYAVNNTFTILGDEPGINGLTPTNDLVITVNAVGTNGQITSVIASGTPPESVDQYYLKVISATECEVYSDPLLQIPVSGIGFPYTAGDYALLPEPFYFNQSIVKYNNRVYQCIISNNDSEFIFGKWELLSSDSRKLNALDRIIGYYQPTVNMPGVDLTQLVDGITYPNSTYLGNAFAPEDEFTLDTDLQDQPFNPIEVDTTSIVWNGVAYLATSNTPTYSDIIQSINGTTWAFNEIAKQPLALTDILYSGTKYVMSSQNNATPILTSNDGVVWSSSITVDSTSLNSVAYYNGVYVAVGENIVSSSNTSTWTERYRFTNVVLNGVSAITVPNFNGFIAVGYGPDYSVIPTVTKSIVLRSLDGTTWVDATPIGSSETLNSVSSSNNTIVILGNNGTIFTSINASNWIDVSTGSDVLVDAAYSTDLSVFVAVGNGGAILTSSDDGATWSSATSGTTENLNSVIWNSDLGEFIVTGNNNVILHSTDGTTWTSTNLFIIEPTVYDVQGDAFTAGYGPEELVPGVVSDNLTMIITTRPGTNWDPEVYAHVGYNVVSVEITPTVGQTTFSFARLTQSPAQISVFQIDSATGLATRLYEPVYSIDWVSKNVELVTALPVGDKLIIDIYEVGNGDQLEKSNSQTDPIRINTTTGFNEINLNCNYTATLTSGSGVIRPGTEPINTIATETDATDDTILCDSVDSMVLNGQIIFNGDVFGNIVADTHYYIKTISTVTNKITVSATLVNGVAGPTFVLATDTGSMDIVIQVGSGLVWTDPIVYNNGSKLHLGYTTRVTQTDSGTNAITCNSTDGMAVGESIVFSDTMFGSDITAQTVYYVQSIIDRNEFTISTTQGGPVLTLSDAAGGAIAITNDYAFGIADNGISAKMIFAAQYDETVDYLNYTVFGETFPDEYGYTIPETQTFTATLGQTTFELTNYVGGDNPTNAIVEINGLRVSSGYTIDSGANEIEFTSGLSAGDIVAVTSYNLTDRQYFNTQYDITGETVYAISFVNNSTDPVQIITSTAHTLNDGDLVRIDGVAGSVQLNNNTYYVSDLGSNLIGLYYDSGLTDPVLSVSSYTSGGYVWLDESFVVVNDWDQDNVDRLWVTINGYRVPSSSLRLNADNNLSILSPITSSDDVTITSMMPSATPSQEVYLQNINKSGTQTVYRANTQTRTWLTQPLYNTSPTIYVNDVTRLTDTAVQNVTAPAAVDGITSIGLSADKNIISQVIVYNSTTSAYIDPENYYVAIVDIAPVLQITDEVTAGDNLIVTTVQGNLVYINGEQIKFTSVDLTANTLSGLQRGTNGTGTQEYIPVYSEVFGILSTNLMSSSDYTLTWNSYIYNSTDGDPLQISETNPAIFLNTDIS